MADDMIRNWRRLVDNVIEELPIGLALGAELIQDAMQATTAYKGLSGATRASSIAYVATDKNNGAAEAESAYRVAEALLESFEGHYGLAHLGSAPGARRGLAKIIATVPTDYAIKLERDNGGERQFIADSLLQHAPEVFALTCGALRSGWHL